MTQDQHYNYKCIHGPRCGSQKTVCKTRSVPTQLITISKTSSSFLHACHNSKILWHTCIMSHAFDLKTEVSLPKHRTVQRLTSLCPCAIPVVPPVTVDQPQANDVVDKQLKLYLAYVRHRQALHGRRRPRRKKQLWRLCEIRPVAEAAGNRWAPQASLHAVA